MNPVKTELPPIPPTPKGLYRHYKGGWYAVVGDARCSETLQGMTLYLDLSGPEAGSLWVRPGSMFRETVEVAGQRLARFAAVDEPKLVVNDARVARAVVAWRQWQLKEVGVVFRPPPPEPTSCCGRGCNGCVWEGYHQALQHWRTEVRQVLMESNGPTAQLPA